MRHARDEQLTSVKSVRECCGLAEVPMKYAMTQFKDAAVEGKLTRIRFMEIYEQLSGEFSHEPISCDIKSSVFSLFDRDGNDCVDMMELICGASLLCKGSDKEKIEAVFFMFDLNGDGFVTIDEMIQFLMMVSQVVFERELSNGAPFNKDIFAEQVVECFLEADLDRDGKLSLFDFKKWFQAPRQEAGLLFTPIRDESNVSRLSSKS
jgi:Ca2+-binding EF-hand superfamily protein